METDVREYEVSVILTLYNSKETFKRALNSVLAQTYKNFELIIVDDGSTDGIEIEILPAVKENNNFKYIRHSNRKHPLSLNTGIVNSSGKFITFLDSDDEYKSSHLEERVNFFLMNPDADLVHSPATIIGNENDLLVPDANDISKMIHINDCIIGGTFFGKKKIFEELNGFRDVYSHDSEFYKRALTRVNVKFFNSPTYIYYRNNPGSLINKFKEKLNEIK